MAAPNRNLELKVPVTTDGLDAARSRLQALTCQPLQRLHQVDTYVQVPRGRLKLREIRANDDPARIERAELIAYARPGEASSRWSDYHVVPVAASAAPALRAALELTHEPLATVEKVRLVGIVGHTRVHLDEVSGLRAFIELETVLSGQSDAEAHTEHDQVIGLLGLDRATAIGGSYSDLLIAHGSEGP
jgi:adenylate cyclase class IV